MQYIHVPSGTEFDGTIAVLLGEGDLATNYPPFWFDDPLNRAELGVVEREYTEAELAAQAQAAQEAADAVLAHAKAEYLTSVRDLRERILNRLAGIAATALILDDAPTTTAFLAARTSLLNITTAPGVASATTVAQCKAAVKAEYALIVAACPSALRTAILTVDA